jgi:hypothetical protein
VSATPFQVCLASLDADAAVRISDVLTSWNADSVLHQLTKNISGEFALSIPAFTSLLSRFATELENKSANAPWVAACRANKFKGSQLALELCPELLGRARTLLDHADAVALASGGRLTNSEARLLLLKYSNNGSLGSFESFLRATALGRYVTWSTYCAANSASSPFSALPSSARAICIALGLGHLSGDELLVLLVWGHKDSGPVNLFRPTIADAEDNVFYRPRSEADATCGLTCPLEPNTLGLSPQPELVSEPVPGGSMRLPYAVVS